MTVKLIDTNGTIKEVDTKLVKDYLGTNLWKVYDGKESNNSEIQRGWVEETKKSTRRSKK